MIQTLFSVSIGWAAGAFAMWWHFSHHKLIRTREEWMRATGRDH